MPEFFSISCPSCGQKLQVGNDIERFACGYCGNELIVKRGGGIVSLSPVIEGIKRVQVGVDRTAAELAIQRIKEEIRDMGNVYGVADDLVRKIMDCSTKGSYCFKNAYQGWRSAEYGRNYVESGSNIFQSRFKYEKVKDILFNLSLDELKNFMKFLPEASYYYYGNLKPLLTLIDQFYSIRLRINVFQEKQVELNKFLQIVRE